MNHTTASIAWRSTLGRIAWHFVTNIPEYLTEFGLMIGQVQYSDEVPSANEIAETFRIISSDAAKVVVEQWTDESLQQVQMPSDDRNRMLPFLWDWWSTLLIIEDRLTFVYVKRVWISLRYTVLQRKVGNKWGWKSRRFDKRSGCWSWRSYSDQAAGSMEKSETNPVPCKECSISRRHYEFRAQGLLD